MTGRRVVALKTQAQAYTLMAGWLIPVVALV